VCFFLSEAALPVIASLPLAVEGAEKCLAEAASIIYRPGAVCSKPELEATTGLTNLQGYKDRIA
jgi:hypothetical protein